MWASVKIICTVVVSSAWGELLGSSSESLRDAAWLEQTYWGNLHHQTHERRLAWTCNTSHPCHNGGICLEDGICKCQDNYVAADCSKRWVCDPEVCQPEVYAWFKALDDNVVCRDTTGTVVTCQEIRVLQLQPTTGANSNLPAHFIHYLRIVHEMNKDQVVLPGYKIVLTLIDTLDIDEKRWEKAFEAVVRGGGLNAFAGAMTMGPPESVVMCHHFSQVARIGATVCTAAGDHIDDPTLNPFVNLYFGPANAFFMSMTALLHKLNWKRLGLMYLDAGQDLIFKTKADAAGLEMASMALVKYYDYPMAGPNTIQEAWNNFNRARVRVIFVQGTNQRALPAFLCMVASKGVRGLTIIAEGFMTPNFETHGGLCKELGVSAEDLKATYRLWTTGTIPLWLGFPSDDYHLDCHPHMKVSELKKLFDDDLEHHQFLPWVFPDSRVAGIVSDQVCSLAHTFRKYLITDGKPLANLYDSDKATFEEMKNNLKNVEFKGFMGQPLSFGGATVPKHDFWLFVDGAAIAFYIGHNGTLVEHGIPKWPDGTEGFENAPPDTFEACAEGEVRFGIGCAGCAPGSYYSGSSCLLCPAGTSAATEGSVACDICQAGYFAGEASTTCQPCPEGTAPGKAGQAACPCDLGYFSSNSTCTRCPDPHHTTAYLAATDESDCLCKAGFYLKPGHGCVDCGMGLECPASNAPPSQAAGYNVQVINEELQEYSVYECFLDPAACPAGPLGGCSGGASGVMCLECPTEPDAMYWSTEENACVKCSDAGGGSWIFPVAMICLLAVMVLLYCISLPKPGNEIASATVELATTAALLLLAFQTISVYSRLDIDWGEPLTSILQACRIFALDFGFLKLDCAMGATYASVFVLGTFFPALVVFTYALAAFALQKLGQADAPLRCWNAVGQLIQGLFTSFLMHGIKPFLFYTHPNGKRSMVSGPEVLLDSDEHKGLAMCGVIHLLIYGGGFLSFCAYAIWQLRKRARGQDSRGIQAVLWYHFFVFKYKPNNYYFGIIMGLRSATIVLTPVIFPTPQSQIMVLQFVLCAYMVVQTLLWPYRYEMHNFADMATSAIMIALTTAGAFFLPMEEGTKDSVVVPVVVFLSMAMLVFLVVLGIPFWKIMSQMFMSKEERMKAQAEQRKLKNNFLAELQNMEKENLEILQKMDEQVDTAAVCGAPLAPVEVVDILTFEIKPPGEDSEVLEVMAPSEHPDMRKVRECLAVLEAKLIHRAQEIEETAMKKAGNRSNHISQMPESPSWNDQEQKQVKSLIERVQTFMNRYANALLADHAVMFKLENYVARMEQQFKGVYSACVRDILQPQPGFDEVLGLARSLKRISEDAGSALPSSWDGKKLELMGVAATTQEALVLYVKALAAATQATSPKVTMKHLYRILEKQALDSNSSLPVWDAARSTVVYDSMQGLLDGLQMLKKDHLQKKIQIRRIKERFSEPTGGGWSDILINFEFPAADPLVCELQMVHVQMLVLRKELGGHHGYAKYRAAREILDLHAVVNSVEAKEFKRRNTTEKLEEHKEPKPVLSVLPNYVDDSGS